MRECERERDERRCGFERDLTLLGSRAKSDPVPKESAWDCLWLFGEAVGWFEE